MERRTLLRTVAGSGLVSSAGCLGGGKCGPGPDTLESIQSRVGDGELPNDEPAITVEFEGEVVRVTDLGRPIIDDGTTKAELYPAGGYRFQNIETGDCLSGSGSAIAKDNEDEERLTIQTFDLN